MFLETVNMQLRVHVNLELQQIKKDSASIKHSVILNFNMACFFLAGHLVLSA